MDIIKREANNLPIEQRQADGYLNATALCKAAGKRFNNYYQLESTNEYLQALQVDTGIPVSELIQIRKGGKTSEQGSWVHPEVAVDLAKWLSPQFRIMVNRWVVEWSVGKQTPPAPQPGQKLFGPSRRFPAVTQEIFDAAPFLDQIHWAESPEEEQDRRQRERKEFWRL